MCAECRPEDGMGVIGAVLTFAIFSVLYYRSRTDKVFLLVAGIFIYLLSALEWFAAIASIEGGTINNVLILQALFGGVLFPFGCYLYLKSNIKHKMLNIIGLGIVSNIFIPMFKKIGLGDFKLEPVPNSE